MFKSRAVPAFDWLLCLFLLIGLLLLAIAAGLFFWQWGRTAGLPRVTGEVVTYRDGAPIVEYRVGHAVFEIHGPNSEKSPPRIGETFTVYYPPEQPAQGRISCPLLQWIFPLFFGFVGGRFTYAAVRAMWGHLAHENPPL